MKKPEKKPSPIIDHLRLLIHKQYQCTPSGGRYLLRETKNQTSKITGIPAKENILICKFDDETKALLPFLNNAIAGAHTMADYIAFVEQSNCCYVYVLELSAQKRKTRQRTATECFATFLQCTVLRTIGHLDTRITFCARYVLVLDKLAPPRGLTQPGHQSFDESGKMLWKAGTDLPLHSYSVPAA